MKILPLVLIVLLVITACTPKTEEAITDENGFVEASCFLLADEYDCRTGEHQQQGNRVINPVDRANTNEQVAQGPATISRGERQHNAAEDIHARSPGLEGAGQREDKGPRPGEDFNQVHGAKGTVNAPFMLPSGKTHLCPIPPSLQNSRTAS